MNFVNEEIISLNRISISNLLQEIGPEEVREEIIAGLTSRQKHISSKYFYNQAGSELFEEITTLEEYYPTRCELGILERIAPSIMDACKAYDIIEMGSGDSSKISILLRAAQDMQLGKISYLPLDISQSAIQNSAEDLMETFPDVHIEGYAVDFTSQFDQIRRERPALICFFGGTIGNFEWEEALKLLQNISSQMKKGDILLMGMDLVKPEAILHAAYNDKQGVTAAFNRNILNTVNDLISSDFQTEDFDHRAFFNHSLSKIEMHLLARRDLLISSPYLNGGIRIQKGESIHTENSHKYSQKHIQDMADACGLRLNETHTENRGWFALTEFQKFQ